MKHLSVGDNASMILTGFERCLFVCLFANRVANHVFNQHQYT